MWAQLDPRTQGGYVVSQTFKFWSQASQSSGYWDQTVRAYREPGGRETLVSRLDVRVVCTCPSWQWHGSDYWALVGGYLYGFPRSDRRFPARADPDGRRPVCKHITAIAKLVRETKLRIAA